MIRSAALPRMTGGFSRSSLGAIDAGAYCPFVPPREASSPSL